MEIDITAFIRTALYNDRANKGNTMQGFSVTFERYYPPAEGEDVCEPDESGFVIEDVSLRDALRFGLECSRPAYAGHCETDQHPSLARWLTFHSWNECTREQIEQGIDEIRALHFPRQLTPSSRRRVCRLFGVRGA